MPSQTVKQQRAMQMALAVKTGALSADKVSPSIRKLAETMSESDLRDFAGAVKKEAEGVPAPKVAKSLRSPLHRIHAAMRRFQKTAADFDDSHQRAVPGYLHSAIMMRRHPHPLEARMIDDGKSNLFPKMMKGPNDPLTEDMASPVKGALLYGALGAGAGGLGAKKIAELYNTQNPTNPVNEKKIALLTSAITAILAGMAAGIYRKERNDDIEDEMLRLPAGATRRDRDLNPVLGGDTAAAELGRVNAALKGRYSAKNFALPADHIPEK